MRTLHKLTHRPLAQRFLLLALFAGLGVAGWHLPKLGSAVLAYSNNAYIAARTTVGHIPAALTVGKRAAATNATTLPQGSGLTREQTKLLNELYGQAQAGGEFALEEIYLLNRFHDGVTLSPLEADTVLKRVLWATYVANRGLSRAQDRLLRDYKAAVERAGRRILDETSTDPKGSSGDGARANTSPTARLSPNAPAVAITMAFTEGFNTVLPAGWFTQNNSVPVGTTNWFQGNPAVFVAQAGPTDSYAGANFNNTGATGDISNWLLTPELALKNGDQIKFWTRKVSPDSFADRLEVRLSTSGAGTNVGTGATGVGTFTTTLLSINPNLALGVYPTVFTQFTVTIAGLAAPTTGRVGFRYFVTGGGLNGANSDFIGIDTFEYAPLQPVTVVASGNATITAESCTPANTTADPGETITVSLCLQNTGAGTPTDVLATLVQDPNAGVIAPSAAQSYGALAPGGAAVCRNFTFTVPSSAVCGGIITARLNLTDGATNLGAVTFNIPIGTTNAPASTMTFTQNTPITIGDVGAVNGAPYPSVLNVAGVTGSVIGVKARLNGVNHTFPDDLDILLVGPTGAGVILMSDAGGATALVNANLTFMDGANYPSDGSTPGVTTGTFAPSNYGAGDTFPAPAPAVPTGAPLNSLFAGQNANGAWNLFVRDGFDGDGGDITSWELEFTTTTVAPTIATTPFSNPAAITIPAAPSTGAATGAPSDPYPSNINVTGLTGRITDISVQLNGYNHTFPSDVDVLLVGPTGVGYTLLSDFGGGTDAVNANLTFRDSATPVGAAAVTGTFRPFNSGATDAFPAPAPATSQSPPSGGVASLLGTYGSLNPNGMWSLFVVDDAGGDTGNLTGGWTISFTTVSFPTNCVTCAQLCTLTPPTNVMANAAAGQCSATVNYTLPTTTGTCGAVTCTPAPGTFPVGVTTVSCLSATGGGFATFTVTVRDTQAPVLTCPANINVFTPTTACAATVSFALPTVTDNCPGVGAVTCTPASGTSFAKGTTTVTCRATDAAGNMSTCSFTVTVTDNVNPTIVCPASQFLGTGGTTAVATWPAPTVADNCPGVGAPVCTPPSGSNFNLGTTTVNCNVMDAVGNTATCSFAVTVNGISPGELADPLECTGPGNVIRGFFTVTGRGTANQTVAVTSTFTAGGLLGLPGNCTVTPAAAGACAITATGVTFNGTVGPNQTVRVDYLAQINDGFYAQVCATTTASFNNGPVSAAVQACLTPNCPVVGPGNSFVGATPERQVVSDQRPGSILIYPVYTSDAANPNAQNSRITITNTDTGRTAFVHFFFLDGSSCTVSDAFICLTANQTASFLASDLDPGVTGHIVAVAVDRTGCPINFNYLIGDEYVKFASGHQGSVGAEAIAAIAGSSFFAACGGNTVSTTLPLDGTAYGLVPHTLALDNIPSRADGNDTLLIIDRVGGDLLTGGLSNNLASGRLSPIFGLLYDDAENSYSFNFPSNNICQFRVNLRNGNPRVTPVFDQIIPAGRSGWMKFYPTSNIGIVAAAFNHNPNLTTNSNAFRGAHNLHKLTHTNAAYTIPVFPPSC